MGCHHVLMPSKSGDSVKNGDIHAVSAFRFGKQQLDETSRLVLRALTADPRRGVAALARELGVSAPTVRDRIAYLERSGVIRGYRLDVDPAALGLTTSAWVRIRPGPGQLPRLIELVKRTPEVSECHRITGDDCLMARVHAPTIELLEQVLDQFLVHGQTSSAVIVSTPVEARPVLFR
jgi:Lrp/AsnC family transcriptional regulator, leucine-responsive regulatory protein